MSNSDDKYFDEAEVNALKKDEYLEEELELEPNSYEEYSLHSGIDRLYTFAFAVMSSLFIVVFALFFYSYLFSNYSVEQKYESKLDSYYSFLNSPNVEDYQVVKMTLDFDSMYEGFNDIPITAEDSFNLKLDFEGPNNFYVFQRDGANLVGKYKGSCIKWAGFENIAFEQITRSLKQALEKDCQLVIKNVKIGHEFLIHTNQPFGFEVTGYHNYGLVMNVETVEVNSNTKFFYTVFFVALSVSVFLSFFKKEK